MTPQQETEFREYVEARRSALLRTAFLVCGDWHRAEDAVQTSLIKLYGKWTRTRQETADAYVRRIVVNVLVDESRRSWFRRERSYAEPPHGSVDPGSPVERLAAVAVLAELPPRQRATLVLRFVFPDSDERVKTNVDVLDPVDGPLPDRMEGLAGCESIEGTCTWSVDLLLVEETQTSVEETRTIIVETPAMEVDRGEDATGDRLPYHGALLGLDDGTVVHVQMGVYGGPGTLSTTPEQLGELAAALPVGDEPSADDHMLAQGEENEERSLGSDEELISACTAR